MGMLIQISVAILCLFFVWRIYKVLKANPEMLSKENLTKSFSTMGILGLILIGLVAMMVLMLR
jgi:hypothetical protein